MPCVGIERSLPPTPNSESLPPTEIQALHSGLLYDAGTRREIPGPSLPPSFYLHPDNSSIHCLVIICICVSPTRLRASQRDT